MLNIVDRVAEGDYSQQIDIQGDGAIGKLGGRLQTFFDQKHTTEERERETQHEQRVAHERLQSHVEQMLEVVERAGNRDYCTRM